MVGGQRLRLLNLFEAEADVHRADLNEMYGRIRGQVYPSVAVATAQGEAELRRAWDGHYRAEAEGVSELVATDSLQVDLADRGAGTLQLAELPGLQRFWAAR